MEFYRYRNIESALAEIENGTLYFASHEELNDPIEGYVKLYFQGDQPAWEGLLNNYVSSLFVCINKYLVTSPQKYDKKESIKEILKDFQSHAVLVDIHAFDDVPLGNHLKSLGERFLDDKLVQKLVKCYGDGNLKCSSKELQLILRSVHHKAFSICIQHLKSNNLIPNFLENDRYKNLPDFPFETVSKVTGIERKIAVDVAENMCSDMMEYMSFIIKSRQKASFIEKNVPYDYKQHVTWANIQVNFPKLYVEQLYDVIYPNGYVICFSTKATDSAMWGNYAQNHEGICFIYEAKTIDESNFISIASNNMEVKPIKYGSDVIERNFFTSLGRLNPQQIKSWLSSADKTTSNLFDTFSKENIESWLMQYRFDFVEKFHRKNIAWKHEQEYRILLHDNSCQYAQRETRFLKYDLTSLSGIIFGINTSIDDKFKLIQAIKTVGDRFKDVKFFQAEYEEDTQEIIIREKIYLDKKNFQNNSTGNTL